MTHRHREHGLAPDSTRKQAYSMNKMDLSIGWSGDDSELKTVVHTLNRELKTQRAAYQRLSDFFDKCLLILETKVFPRAKRNDECVVCYSVFQKGEPVMLCTECCNATCVTCHISLPKPECPICAAPHIKFNH